MPRQRPSPGSVLTGRRFVLLLKGGQMLHRSQHGALAHRAHLAGNREFFPDPSFAIVVFAFEDFDNGEFRFLFFAFRQFAIAFPSYNL